MAHALLIAAQSGRALAAAARRAGFRPFVADLFGDEDTRGLAEAWRRLPGRLGAGPRASAVMAALDELAREAGGEPFGLVLGSGFERAPDLIATLAGRYRLLGTDAATVARLKDPLRLAKLLADLAIPHPPVTLGAVPDPGEWLSKRRGGSGGGHIRAARAGAPPRGRYHQRRVAGGPIGIAFLADGQDAQWIAATEQWVAPGPGAPYRFAGALEPAALAPGMRDSIEDAVRRLAAATGIRGLASADCLVDGERWWLLEINPRPGGTIDVLDRRTTPFLLRHVEACLGRLGSPEPAPPGACATRILHWDGASLLVPPIDWPDWVMDRPAAGSWIERGSPICTVWAEGMDAGEACTELERRAAAVRRIFSGEGDHGYGIDGARGTPEREPARGRTG